MTRSRFSEKEYKPKETSTGQNSYVEFVRRINDDSNPLKKKTWQKNIQNTKVQLPKTNSINISRSNSAPQQAKESLEKPSREFRPADLPPLEYSLPKNFGDNFQKEAKQDFSDERRPLTKIMWVCLAEIPTDSHWQCAAELTIVTRTDKMFGSIQERLLEKEKSLSTKNPESYAKQVYKTVLFSSEDQNRFLAKVGNTCKARDNCNTNVDSIQNRRKSNNALGSLSI